MQISQNLYNAKELTCTINAGWFQSEHSLVIRSAIKSVKMKLYGKLCCLSVIIGLLLTVAQLGTVSAASVELQMQDMVNEYIFSYYIL